MMEFCERDSHYDLYIQSIPMAPIASYLTLQVFFYFFTIHMYIVYGSLRVLLLTQEPIFEDF
jgi:hypothetical protein